jgi:hypothetical protein
MSKKHTIDITEENIQKKQKTTHQHFNEQAVEFSVIREEKIDLDTLKYLILLILSHEQYKTKVPEWLVSTEWHDDAGTQTKGEYIKSKLMCMYWKGREVYKYRYRQKQQGSMGYGGWILQKPSDYMTSAHAMKRELRANLFHKNYVDVDIENAFPCLLLGRIESLRYHPDEYKVLKRYVTQREGVLEQVMNEKHCSRGVAKKSILALMFKNPDAKFRNLSTFETAFESEIKSIGEKLLKEEGKNGIDWIALSSKKHQGAGLSVLLQTMCADCLKEGVLELQRQNCQVGALIFDGCLVEISNYVSAAIEKVNEKLPTSPEFKYIKFCIKEFPEPVDISKELPVKFIRKNFNNNTTHYKPLPWNEILPDNDLVFETVKEWCDFKYTLVTRLNTRFAMVSQGSSLQKTFIMEKELSKVNQRTGVSEFPGYKYVMKSDRDVFSFHRNKILTVTIKEIIGKDDRPSGFQKKTGRTSLNVLDIWNLGFRNSYSLMDYNPIPLGERGSVNDHTFNWFYGFRISREKAKQADDNGSTPVVVIDFIKGLTGNNKVVYEYIFTWCAFLLQNPAEIPGVMLVMQSAKGVGKSLFYEILKLILGEINCTSIAEMEYLVGQFNAKRKDKKLVALEEIGSSVYDPKNWGKMKDMITGSTQGFNRKHMAIEDSPSVSGFIQFTNDDDCVRVDDNGIRRVYLVKCDNYWSYKACEINGRVEERRDKFHTLVRRVLRDKDGCLSAFAHFLYEYPLKKDGDHFVRLEHYGIKCPALHEQAMRSLTIPAQMVVGWIEGDPVWSEDHKYSERKGEIITNYEKTVESHYIHNNEEVWVPRKPVHTEYVRLYKEQKRGKPSSQQVFWTDLRKYIDIGNSVDRSRNGRRTRGLMFPSKRDMLKRFKEIVPDYDFDIVE